MPYLGEHQTYNPRAVVQLPSKFLSVVKVLNNLTNLSSGNLRITQMPVNPFPAYAFGLP